MTGAGSESDKSANFPANDCEQIDMLTLRVKPLDFGSNKAVLN